MKVNPKRKGVANGQELPVKEERKVSDGREGKRGKKIKPESRGVHGESKKRKPKEFSTPSLKEKGAPHNGLGGEGIRSSGHR